MRLIASQIDTVNLTMIAPVLSLVPNEERDVVVKVELYFGGGEYVPSLSGNGGIYTFWVNKDGFLGQPVETVSFSPGVQNAWMHFMPISVLTGAELVIMAHSPNETETDVQVTALVYDITPVTLDGDDTIDGATVRQALQRIGATTAGKASGAGTGTETFTGFDGTTERVVVTVEPDGNRTNVSYDPAP